MADKTVAEKARIRPGTTYAVILAEPPGVVESLALPDGCVEVPSDQAQLVFMFVHTHADLDTHFARTVATLAPEAVLWVFFRKGSKAAGYDVNRDDVWAAAEKLGMRPLGLVGIDETWSAFRLRPGT